MNRSAEVLAAMVRYYAGDAKRINHFVKVYGYAKAIGELEGLDGQTLKTLEIAALTHDIGIKISEQKYGSASGHNQQIEGPPEAKKLLDEIGIDPEIIDRCCWLIAHHHTYGNIDTMDHQILFEADFLVNAYEEKMMSSAIESARKKIFRTKSGKMLLDEIFKEST